MVGIVDKNPSIQVRIDRGYHKLLSELANRRSVTIKSLLEGYIAEGLYKDKVLGSK